MKIKQYLIEYIRIMLYTIIILLSIFTGFAPGLFRFSLVKSTKSNKRRSSTLGNMYSRKYRVQKESSKHKWINHSR